MRELVLALVVLAPAIVPAQQDPDQLLKSAVELQQRGEYQAAISKYRKLLQLRPDNAEVKVNLGAALVHVGQFDEAISMYQSALPLIVFKNPVLLDIGLAYFKKGDMINARRQFEALHQAEPNNVQVSVLLADAEVELGDAESAVTLLSPQENRNSTNADFEYVLGLSMAKAGRRRDAISRLEAAGQVGNSPDAYMLAGATLLDLNDYEGARHDLEQALRLNPKVRGLFTLVGMARDKTGDQKEAEPVFREALKEDPDDFNANLYLGALLYKKRELDEARVYLDRAVKLKPTDLMARYESALVKSSAGEYEDAAHLLESVVKENPDWLEPHVELASLYYKLHRPDEGAKERETVDRLTAAQQAKGPGK
jgi:tetratricopeptide (TPR) repeat protein